MSVRNYVAPLKQPEELGGNRVWMPLRCDMIVTMYLNYKIQPTGIHVIVTMYLNYKEQPTGHLLSS